MNTSGGLFYHLRALRYQKSLWARYQQETARFLEAWNPKAKTLVLVGPSAGYSLPLEFLKRFEKIIAVEPDALSRILFTQRFGIRPEWIKKPLNFERGVDPKDFPPDCAFLFANVLGQVRIFNVSRFSENLKRLVDGHEWASYHDAFSGERLEFDTELATHRKATLAEMKSWIYLKSTGLTTLEINAHVAPDLFSEKDQLQYRYWQWRLTPKRTHLIEGVFQKPNGAQTLIIKHDHD